MATTVSGTTTSEAVISTSISMVESRRTIYSAPWNVTDDFKNACRASKQIPIVLVQALDKYLVPIADITDDVEDGNVTIDVNRGTRRTVQLRLVNEGGKYTPNDSSDYFFWNNIIRVHRGLRYIGSDGIETDEYVCLGTFMVDRPEVFVERNMSVLNIDGSDFYKKVATGGFSGQMSFPEGALVGDVISRILQDAGIPPYQMNIYNMDDESDPWASSNLVTNPSFETNTTGWDSPASPTVWETTGISWNAKLYIGSGATLTRTASPYQAPNGGSWCLKVSGASCRAAHCTVTASFVKGKSYYVKAYFRKVTPTGPVSGISGFIGSSGYMKTTYPTNIADTSQGSCYLYSWPEDSHDASFYGLDEKPWVEMTMVWKPSQNYSSAELYFYNHNIDLVWDQKSVNKPGQSVVIGETEYTAMAQDYYLDAVYVGEYNVDTMVSERRTQNPVQWLYGDSRDKLLQDLLNQFSLDGYFDVYGVYRVVKKKDPTEEIPIWTFSPGEDSTMLGISRIQDDMQLVNHIIVTNEGSNTYTNTIASEVQVTDTNSPYHKTRIGDRVMVFKMSQISSQTTADEAARNMFRKYGSIAEEIKLPTLCLPFLEGNDVVSVVEPLSGTSDNYSCQRITVPLREIRMNIESKRSEVVV